MPDFPIVDSHVHLYDPGRLRYSWMGDKPVYKGRHEVPEFDRACGPVQVEKTVQQCFAVRVPYETTVRVPVYTPCPAPVVNPCPTPCPETGMSGGHGLFRR